MRNIPTDLLRTVIAVVDLRSFTKAANALGVTQPAVSAQVKRLQSLLGCELLDKSAPGVSLTPTGAQVVSEARRLLAINDRIFDLAAPVREPQTLRFGMPGDFVSPALWYKLAHFRARWPDARLHMRTGSSDDLRRALQQGDLDLVVAMSAAPYEDARHHWTEDVVWVRGALTALDPAAPVPLVTRGGTCVFHRRMVAALDGAGRSYNVVLTASRINDLHHAVAAGLGVTALARALAATDETSAWEDGALPKLDGLACNICVRDAAATPALDELADVLVGALHPPPHAEHVGGGGIAGPGPADRAEKMGASM
jgi:DNA-binding transcriptional LysR family regulator